MATLIFLVGTRGAGKSTVLTHLEGRGIGVLKPSTTRSKRHDSDSEYYFETDWPVGDLAWDIQIDNDRYGMREEEVNRVHAERLAVTVFHPSCIETLEKFRSNTTIEAVTVGLDTVANPQVQASRTGHDKQRSVDERELLEHRKAVAECDIVLSGETSIVCDAVLSVCRILMSRGGIVDASAIKSLLRAGALLQGANPSNVQGASYDLSLGTQAWCQGEFRTLDDKHPSLRIPPYSYAIITAEERASIPKFMCANYDLTVSGFMDGLILSNGPQVDPGYRGALFCTLFNGTDIPRGVTKGRHVATIQFSTVTHVAEGYGGRYQGGTNLWEFVSENTAVSPGGNIVERIDKLEKSIDKKVAPVRQMWWSSLAILMLIHISVAGWLWWGGPNLGKWVEELLLEVRARSSVHSDTAGQEPAGAGGNESGQKTVDEDSN